MLQFSFTNGCESHYNDAGRAYFPATIIISACYC